MRPEASSESYQVPQVGDVIAGKYRVESVVGTGGMGVVLSALHLRLGQNVAIKVLTMSGVHEERRQVAQARFLREAQAAAGLTSDHVVRVFDVGTLESGLPYMVMELLSGDDLAAVLDREGPLEVEAAVDCVAQACDAIAEAHARGIAHRDLKPANLFVARKKDGRATVKVLDFGISKAVVGGEDPLDGNLTATRSVVGSPYYMSPEQVRDAKRVDTRTDIWSLGMILYELLIGETAFDAETLPGICAAIVADPPPPIRMSRRDVPIELEAVVLRCLEKDPGQRFQTVTELQLALTPFLSDSAAARFASSSGGGLNLSSAAPQRMSLSSAGRTSASRQASDARQTPGAIEFQDTAAGSAPPAAEQAPAAQPAPAAQRPVPAVAARGGERTWIAVGSVAIALGAVGAVYFAPRSAQPPAAPAALQRAQPASFSLTIESTPAGADVVEGGRVLGTTPLSIRVEASSVASAPRELWLKLAGHVPYRILQGRSPSDVRLVATLSAAAPSSSPPAPASAGPTAEPRATAAAEPHRSSSRRRAPRPVPAATPQQAPAATPQQAPPAAGASDIRLER